MYYLIDLMNFLLKLSTQKVILSDKTCTPNAIVCYFNITLEHVQYFCQRIYVYSESFFVILIFSISVNFFLK